MPLIRYALMMITLFSLAGVPVSFAASKPLKAKITQQPGALTVELGQSVELQVVYSSTTTATCQWRHDKVPVSGATDSTYVIDTVLPEDAGKYDVLITNAAGVTTSRTVVLDVNIAPLSLPVDTVLYGNFTMRVAGESVSSDGAYLVTGATTLQDPEAPTDGYTFTYTRQPKNRAQLVINGHFYDSDLGDYITSQETYTLTFTGVSPDGELQATAKAKGVFIPPAGYRPAKLAFTAQGSIAVQLGASAGSASGGTLTLAGGGTTVVPSTAMNVGSLTRTGSVSNTYAGSSTATRVSVNAGTLVMAGSSLLPGATLTTTLLGDVTTSLAQSTGGANVSITSVTTPNFGSGVIDLSEVATLGTYSFSFSESDGILSLQLIEPSSGATTL